LLLDRDAREDETKDPAKTEKALTFVEGVGNGAIHKALSEA
jgi:hypothetical protein